MSYESCDIYTWGPGRLEGGGGGGGGGALVFGTRLVYCLVSFPC